jgi:hypothetical protein
MGQTIDFGHYYTLIKKDDKVWYSFNDEKVEEISNLDALNISTGA